MSADVVIVGGGIIGLACAWRAAGRGLGVTVVDDAVGRGASHVAAGMLAPVTEVRYGDEDLVRLTIDSSRRWPRFAADLAAAADRDVGYRRSGTLLVGYDADDVRVLDDLLAFLHHLGLDAERIRGSACRRREPLLSPRVRGGVLAGDDHHTDPRRVVAALEVAGARAGVTVVADRVARVDVTGGRVTGVTLRSGRNLPAGQVVVAAGTWTTAIDGLDAVPPVRPVKGEVLRLRHPDGDPVLEGPVRGVVQGRRVYLVPRGDGRVVVGATEEEQGWDTAVTAGGVRRLLDDAARIVPAVDELELVESLAGLRPGTPDNTPLIGRTGVDGLLLATGHYRHGILLTPVTADAIVALLTGEPTDAVVAVADPSRFAVARPEVAS